METVQRHAAMYVTKISCSVYDVHTRLDVVVDKEGERQDQNSCTTFIHDQNYTVASETLALLSRRTINDSIYHSSYQNPTGLNEINPMLHRGYQGVECRSVVAAPEPLGIERLSVCCKRATVYIKYIYKQKQKTGLIYISWTFDFQSLSD